MIALRRCLPLVAAALLTACFMPFGPRVNIDFPDYESWERVSLPAGATLSGRWKRPDRIVVLPPRIGAEDAQAPERAAAARQVLVDELSRFSLNPVVQEVEEAGTASTVYARLVVGAVQVLESGARATSELHLEVTGVATAPLRFTEIGRSSSVWFHPGPKAIPSMQLRASQKAARSLAFELYSMATPPGIVRERRGRGPSSLVRISMGPVGGYRPGDIVGIRRVGTSGTDLVLGTARVTRQIFNDHLWLLVEDKRLADGLREGDFVRPLANPGLENLLD